MGERHSTSGGESAGLRIVADRFVVRDAVPGRDDAWLVDDRFASPASTAEPYVLVDAGPLDARAIVLRALVIRRLELAPPHATRYIDCISADGRLYVVRTQAGGITLASRLHEAGVLSPDEALHVAVRILEAASVLHERGLSVGGFRAEDIELVARPGRRDRIVLTEWRGPRSPNPSSLPSHCDARAIAEDVRSLGELLLVSLCGPTTVIPPLDGPDQAVLEALAERIPMPIARVVHRCLRRNPEERPPNALAVLRALARRVPTASHRSVSDRPTEPHPGTPRPIAPDRSIPIVERPTRAFALRPTARRWLTPVAIAAGLALAIVGYLGSASSPSEPLPAHSGLPRPHAAALRSAVPLAVVVTHPPAVGQALASLDEPSSERRAARRKRSSRSSPRQARIEPEPEVAASAPRAESTVVGRKLDRNVLLPMDRTAQRRSDALLPMSD